MVTRLGGKKKEEEGVGRTKDRGKDAVEVSPDKEESGLGPFAQVGSVVLGAKLYTQGRDIPSKGMRGS